MDEPIFTPLGNGTEWKVADGRFVAIMPGENNEVLLRFKNGDRMTHIRLSKEAARATIVALVRYVDGADLDFQTPKAA